MSVVELTLTAISELLSSVRLLSHARFQSFSYPFLLIIFFENKVLNNLHKKTPSFKGDEIYVDDYITASIP